MAKTVYRMFDAKLFIRHEFDALERERSDLIQRVNSLSAPKLPIKVTLSDISVLKLKGHDFSEHVDFCKQTIVNALATP